MRFVSLRQISDKKLETYYSSQVGKYIFKYLIQCIIKKNYNLSMASSKKKGARRRRRPRPVPSRPPNTNSGNL